MPQLPILGAHETRQRAKRLVGKYARSILHPSDFHDEARNIVTIFANIRPQQTEQDLLFHAMPYLDELDPLYCPWLLRSLHVQPQREDLEPAGAWQMPQLSWHFDRWRCHQHILRFLRPRPSSDVDMAATDGNET